MNAPKGEAGLGGLEGKPLSEAGRAPESGKAFEEPAKAAGKEPVKATEEAAKTEPANAGEGPAKTAQERGKTPEKPGRPNKQFADASEAPKCTGGSCECEVPVLARNGTGLRGAHRWGFKTFPFGSSKLKIGVAPIDNIPPPPIEGPEY